mgnify:CR=1 FL=1
MKQKWTTVADYLNPPIIKPINEFKVIEQKTDAHKRLIVKQESNNGILNREFLDHYGVHALGKGFMEELDKTIIRIKTNL